MDSISTGSAVVPNRDMLGGIVVILVPPFTSSTKRFKSKGLAYNMSYRVAPDATEMLQ